jgi:hypothetical protein
MKSQSDILYTKIEAYLQSAVPQLVDSWNEKHPGESLSQIMEWDRGYRDILTGLREYPAILLIEKGRSYQDSYTTRHTLVIGLAYTCDDMDMLQTHGQAYVDILEECIRADWHLGDACLDAVSYEIDTDIVTSIFVVACTLTINLDRGGFV